MKKITLVLGIIVFAAFSVNALEITLESAAEIALGNNRVLLASYAEQRTRDRNKRSGWNEFFPDLYVSTGLVQNNQIPQYITASPWNFFVAVGGSIELSAATVYRIKGTRLAWEQGLISIEEFEHSVVTDARKGFLSLLLLRDTIEIYELMVTTAEARYNRAKRRFEIGDARKLDMLSFQVAWQNMMPQLTNLRNAFAVNELEFRRLLGLPEDEPITLVGEIEANEENWDAATLISSRLNRRYDVRSVQTGIMQLENERSRRISDGMTPKFGISYKYAPTINDPFGDPSVWSNYSGGVSLGLILPLDGFIPNTKKSLAVKEVKDGLDAAEQRLADTLQAGAIAINSAVLNLNKSATSLRSLELNVVLAEESYDLVSRSYDVGEADYLQVQTADDELNTARIQLVNEKFNYASNLQDLDFAIASALEVTPTPLEAVVSQPETE